MTPITYHLVQVWRFYLSPFLVNKTSHTFVVLVENGQKKMHSSPYDYPPPGYSPYYYPPIVFPQPFEHSQGFHHYSMPDTRPIHPPPIVPHENDVLMGRGGKNNQHSGNEKLRQIARQYSDKYRTSTKKEKSNLSRELVKQMRKLNPPARLVI